MKKYIKKLLSEVSVKNLLKSGFSLDLRSLALFRVSLGFLILADLFNRSAWLLEHYSDVGVLPRSYMTGTFSRYFYNSIHFFSGETWAQGLLFVVAAVFAIALLVGYRTRLMTILSWLMLLSLQARNPVILQGGDVEFRLLLFWSIFLPLGARYSIDAALNQNRLPEKMNRYFGIGCVCLIAQAILIYYVAGVLKSGAEWRTTFTANYYALNLEQFTTALGSWLLNFPELLKVLTFKVFYWELLGAFLLIVPFKNHWFRLIAIFGFVAMHMSFVMIMKLGLFPFISSTLFLALIPGQTWNFLYKKLKRPDPSKLTIFYDGDCGFCKKLAYIIRELLGLRQIPIEEAQNDPKALRLMNEKNSWVLKAAEEDHKVEFEAIIELVRHSPVFFFCTPVLKLGFLRKWGRRAYRFVADNRNRFGRLTQPLRWHKKKWKLGWSLSIVAGFALILVVWWNIGTVEKSFRVPYPLKRLPLYARLDQKWNMFAPYPLKIDGWYIVLGTKLDGFKVDLMRNAFQGSEKISFEKPDSVSSLYPSQRWRKYMMNLRRKKYKRHRGLFLRHLCRKWNYQASGMDQLKEIELIFMKERTPPPGQTGRVERLALHQQSCLRSR